MVALIAWRSLAVPLNVMVQIVGPTLKLVLT